MEGEILSGGARKLSFPKKKYTVFLGSEERGGN